MGVYLVLCYKALQTKYNSIQLLEYAKKLHHDSRKDKKDDDSAKEHIDGRNVCYLVS